VTLEKVLVNVRDITQGGDSYTENSQTKTSDAHIFITSVNIMLTPCYQHQIDYDQHKAVVA
jgi:hypothetical protein